MNLEEKVDAILAAVSTPVVATVDPTVLANAVAPLAVQLTAIQAGISDIQGQVDEPVAPTTTPAVGSA